MKLNHNTYAQLTATGLTESVFASAAKSLSNSRATQAARHIHVLYSPKHDKFHGYLHGRKFDLLDGETLHNALSNLGYDRSTSKSMIDAFKQNIPAGEADHVCCNDIEHAWKHTRTAMSYHMNGNANGKLHHLKIAHSFLDHGMKLLGGKSDGRTEHLADKISDIQNLTKQMSGSKL